MSFDIAVSLRIGAKDLRIEFATDAPLTAIVGPSGAGKTTLLKMIAGLVRPDSGRIEVEGKTLFDSERGVNMPIHERRAGYVFQDNRLFPHLSVAANLAYGERLAPVGQSWMGREEAIDFLALSPLLHRWPSTLSGGEARRLAIGRALLSAPRFLLLDEPLTSLDAPRREEILRVIEHIRDRIGVPILYVSHVEAEVDRLTCSVIRLD